MKKWPLFERSNFSQKKVFWGIIGITILIFLFVYGILPLIETKRKTEEEIALKRKALSKYEEYIRNRKTVEEELDLALKQVEGIQQKLLSGETPQLGAASLQEIIKRLSEKNGIAIRSFRILEPKEMDIYRRVSIHIDFSPTNSLLSIGQFIYDIEHHEKELMIPEMDLVVINIRMPNNMQGSIVISGWMKGPKIKEKGREG